MAHVPNSLQANSRRFRLVQSLHYLVGNGRSLLQILIELIISAISLRALAKCIKWSTWPVGLHQPEYMPHVLSGGCGDIPFKALGNFAKPPHQCERFVFTSLRDLHKPCHFLSSTPQLHELLLHQVSGL